MGGEFEAAVGVSPAVFARRRQIFAGEVRREARGLISLYSFFSLRGVRDSCTKRGRFADPVKSLTSGTDDSLVCEKVRARGRLGYWDQSISGAAWLVGPRGSLSKLAR
jgi:hypothetical protein